jgi:DNA-binding transcriptional MerR regulator
MPDAAPRKDSWKTAEVCKGADVAPYVLKYWITEFPILSVDKDKGPNRIFTAREVEIIKRIRQLLYDEGFTIAGAKKKIDAEITAGNFDGRPKPKVAAAPAPAPAAAPRPLASPPPAPAAPAVDTKKIARELREILKMLK